MNHVSSNECIKIDENTQMSQKVADGPEIELARSCSSVTLEATPLEVCSTGAGGKPSTWFPPGRLVEHTA